MVHPPTRQLRISRRIGTFTAIAALIALTTVGCSPDQNRTNDVLLINQERAAAAGAGLSWDDELGDKAQVWADHIADAGGLSHSVLTDGITSDWTTLGENVGTGADLGGVHGQFMGSPKHRAAILNRQFRSVGVGYAVRGDQVYVVEEFRG